MKKLLISTLTALMLVGMVGCTHKVTIKVETPTIETETQKETETKTETQEEIQETTQEETEETTEEETETETETQEEIQEITEEPCVEQPVETYQETQETQETKKYIKTEEKVQYEYNPDWGYDPVLDCYFEILPNTNFRYYKLDETTGKYDIVEKSEPVDCGIAEKYEPEGYQPTINYYLEPEYVESNENFVYDPFSDCYVEASQTINDTNYYKLDETNGKYKKIPNPYYNTCN